MAKLSRDGEQRGGGVSRLPPKRWVIPHPSHTLQSWIQETGKSTLVLFNSHAPNLVGLFRQITASEMWVQMWASVWCLPVNAEGGKRWMVFLSKLLSFQEEIEMFWLKLTLWQFFFFLRKIYVFSTILLSCFPLKKLVQCSKRVLIWFLVPPAGPRRNYSQLPAAFAQMTPTSQGGTEGKARSLSITVLGE